MPNLLRLSQAPFISPTNNMQLIPCFMDEVHAVSYLVLSITSNCLQLPASVFKAISLLSPKLDENGTCSQRRASSSSLSSDGSEGAGNQRGEAYLQLTSHYFCLLHSGRCSPDYMLVQQCQPSIEVSRLLDWTGSLRISPVMCWSDLGHLRPSSPRSQITAWGSTTVVLGPPCGCTNVWDVAGPGSAG